MKTIIYKVGGNYYTTTEENYKARIQNAKAIRKMEDFSSGEEIIKYFCTYCGSKPEDFIIAISKEG